MAVKKIEVVIAWIEGGLPVEVDMIRDSVSLNNLARPDAPVPGSHQYAGSELNPAL
jgi:hypothetical protein